MSNFIKSIRSKRIMLVAICSSLSGLLFGYDAGIISGSILFMKDFFRLSTWEVSVVVSVVPLGAMLSALFSGYFSDLYGRKKLLYFSSTCFIIGTLFCYVASSFIILVMGRIIIGLAIGIGSCVSPVYTSELSHKEQRGQLVNLFVLSVQIGVFISFTIGYLLSNSGNWQLMIMIGIIPAILFLLGVIFLDESPRWLVLMGKSHQASLVLNKFYTPEETENIIKDIKSTIGTNKATLQSIIEQPRFLKIIAVGVIISVFTQTVGINAFNYYAPTIFQSTGFARPSESTFYTMLMGLSLVLSTFSSLFYVDKIGRRKPLIFGTIAIIFILASIILGFSFITDNLLLGFLFFVCSVLFMIVHGLSIGPACFLIPSEVFPNKIRGLGMGVSITTNWLSNVIIAALIPFILDYLGTPVLFAIFLILTIIGLVLFIFFIPETKGASLENIEKNILANVALRDIGGKY